MISPHRTLAAAIVVLAASTPACAALLDWNDLTGGAGDEGGVEGGVLDATTDVVVPCGNGGTCAPNAPANWLGPVALYVGAGPAPACDADASSLFDGMGDLLAHSATCSTCGCGAPSNESCAGPVVTLFEDLGCTKPLGMTVTASSACTATPAAAVTVGSSVASGSCGATGGVATLQPPTWGTTARACPLSFPGSCSGGGLCVPAQPASVSVCVMQQGAATSCPPGYTSGPQVLYTGVADSRGCTPCTCGLSGASCSIASPAVGAFDAPPCTTASVTMSAPASCTALNGSFFTSLVAIPTLASAGSCSVSGGGSPTGTASGSNATSFCCIP